MSDVYTIYATVEAFRWTGGTIDAAALPVWARVLALHTEGGPLTLPRPRGGTLCAEINDWIMRLPGGYLIILPAETFATLTAAGTEIPATPQEAASTPLEPVEALDAWEGGDPETPPAGEKSGSAPGSEEAETVPDRHRGPRDALDALAEMEDDEARLIEPDEPPEMAEVVVRRDTRPVITPLHRPGRR